MVKRIPNYHESQAEFQEFFWHQRGSQGDIGESGDETGQVIPAMEPIFEFGEVALCVFRPEGMVAATQGRLPIAEHGIDPVELRLRHRGTPHPH